MKQSERVRQRGDGDSVVQTGGTEQSDSVAQQLVTQPALPASSQLLPLQAAYDFHMKAASCSRSASSPADRAAFHRSELRYGLERKPVPETRREARHAEAPAGRTCRQPSTTSTCFIPCREPASAITGLTGRTAGQRDHK